MKSKFYETRPPFCSRLIFESEQGRVNRIVMKNIGEMMYNSNGKDQKSFERIAE